MPESYGIIGWNPTQNKKKGPKTYKAAKGGVGKATYANMGGKPATKKRLSIVDKKVKRISNKIVAFKSKNPGPAAYDRYTR